MEALALLCTLHADGPSSLRRLRRAGCASLAHLEHMPADELAQVLEVPPAVARRLVREARGLSSRLDLGLDDREEGPELGAPAEAPPPPSPSASGLDRRDLALLDQVVERWREADREADREAPRGVPPLVMDELPAVDDPGPGLAETVEARPEGGGSASLPDPEPEVEQVPVPAEMAPQAEMAEMAPTAEMAEMAPTAEMAEMAPTGLRGGEVDGLDADLAAALASAGVLDLRGLADADALALSRDLGRPFSVLRRVQFLAARIAPEGEPARSTAPTEQAPTEQAPTEQAPTEQAPTEQAQVEPAPVVELSSSTPANLLPMPLGEASVVEAAPPARAAEPTTPAPEADALEGATPSVRKFWEPLPRWAEQLEESELEQPIPLPSEDPTPPATSRPLRRRSGRTLNWTFEMPLHGAPAPTPEVDKTLGTPSVGPAPLDPPREDEGAAGPFA